jgi:hypothetical protein
VRLRLGGAPRQSWTPRFQFFARGARLDSLATTAVLRNSSTTTETPCRSLRQPLDRLDHSFLPQRALAMVDLATVLARKHSPEPERAADLLSDAIELAEIGGLIEARMRVMDARRYLQQWKDDTFILALDERLRTL